MPGDTAGSPGPGRPGVALEPWIPYRICCGKQHWTVHCPDWLVMCCICFHRFPVELLAVDEDGLRWDMCEGCGKRNREYAERAQGQAGQAGGSLAQAPGEKAPPAGTALRLADHRSSRHGEVEALPGTGGPEVPGQFRQSPASSKEEHLPYEQGTREHYLRWVREGKG